MPNQQINNYATILGNNNCSNCYIIICTCSSIFYVKK